MTLPRRLSPPGGRPTGTLFQVALVAVTLLAALVGLAGGYIVHGLTTGGATPSPVDVGFLQDMIQHHQQAVLMSRLIEGKAGPQINSLAQGVASDQLREIGRMEGYLDLWGEPSVSSLSPMAWMIQPGPHHSTEKHLTAMPGVLTQDELNRLGQATGTDVDRLYLSLMIRHHHGAVEMANHAIHHASTAQVRNFATAIAFHQQDEIQGMSRLMARLPD